jgi:hypothetical protein
MMVVVPTFAETEDSKHDIVSALVAGPIGLAAPKMAD